MKLILFVAAVVVTCQASTFLNAPRGNGCSYPNWKCDCKVVYRCDGDSEFPTDFSVASDAGYIKDLAPDDYQLRIPGKRWRRNIWSQEEFCKNECYDRLNAFLCLEENGDLSVYAGAALCLKLLAITPNNPFGQTGSNEPCCEVYLQWGLNWCPAKWNNLRGTVRCLVQDLDGTFDSIDVDVNVFGVDLDCDVPSMDYGWCVGDPTCPTV